MATCLPPCGVVYVGSRVTGVVHEVSAAKGSMAWDITSNDRRGEFPKARKRNREIREKFGKFPKARKMYHLRFKKMDYFDFRQKRLNVIFGKKTSKCLEARRKLEAEVLKIHRSPARGRGTYLKIKALGGVNM